MINYVIGDATNPIGEGPKIIAHVVNDVGAWGSGFVLAVSKKCPQAESKYRRLSTLGRLVLGEVHFAQVEPGLWIANMVAQHGLRSRENPIPLRLDALAKCLATVNEIALRHSFHMPRIGCGLAGGTWSDVEPVIARELVGVDVYVYDLPGEKR